MHQPTTPPASPAPENDLTLEVYRSLLRTSRRLRREMRALFEAHGLTGSQYAIMSRIPPGGITLTQLAEVAWVDPGNTSGIVDRLAREGWVERTRSEEDRRVVRITLSEKGANALKELEPKHREAVRSLLSALTPGETAELGRLLEKICSGLPSPAGEEEDV